MRAKEGRHEIDRMLAIQTADHAQHLEFGVQLQPVPALRLARRRAAAQHVVEACLRLGGERVFARVSRGADRGQNAAAFGGNLRVSCSRQPAPQFFQAVAREDHVRVRVNEAGNERAVRRVDDPRIGRWRDLTVALGCRSNEDNGAAVRGEGAVWNLAGVGLCGAAARGRSSAREDRSGVADDEVGRGHGTREVSAVGAELACPEPVEGLGPISG